MGCQALQATWHAAYGAWLVTPAMWTRTQAVLEEGCGWG